MRDGRGHWRKTQPGSSLAIARILRPQGRKGEVAAEILTDFPARFQQLQSVFLEVPGQAPKPVNLERGWPHKGRIILKFQASTPLTALRACAGSKFLSRGSSARRFPRTITTCANCTDAGLFGSARDRKLGR